MEECLLKLKDLIVPLKECQRVHVGVSEAFKRYHYIPGNVEVSKHHALYVTLGHAYALLNIL